MTTPAPTTAPTAPAPPAPSAFPRVIALVAAAGFLLTGVGAMAAPQQFYDAAATFAPYNQHFLQDIGAFNLGLGVVLLLAARPAADALRAALVGAAVGAWAHVLSHVIGHDLGGQPAVDIPLFTVVAVLLVLAALRRHRELVAAA